MKNLVVIMLMALCSVCALAQPYKVVKISGATPIDKITKKKVEVGSVLNTDASLNWHDDEAWLKVYNLKNRRMAYIGSKGISYKSQFNVTGNSALSCRVSLEDGSENGKESKLAASVGIPQDFRVSGASIVPSSFDIDASNILISPEDYVYANFYSNGYKSLKLPLINKCDGKYTVALNRNLLPDTSKSFYISFYLVHNSNYSLLKSSSVIWF